MCHGFERRLMSGRRDEDALGEVRRLFERYRAEARRYHDELTPHDDPVPASESREPESAPKEPILV